ncbi:hypothetical protein C8F01DRAFT_1081545 [Mycena amicta]|nr:hypothetical protein C8F01DRAFT_1081545 [Mycena amicta]
MNSDGVNTPGDFGTPLSTHSQESFHSAVSASSYTPRQTPRPPPQSNPQPYYPPQGPGLPPAASPSFVNHGLPPAPVNQGYYCSQVSDGTYRDFHFQNDPSAERTFYPSQPLQNYPQVSDGTYRDFHFQNDPSAERTFYPSQPLLNYPPAQSTSHPSQSPAAHSQNYPPAQRTSRPLQTPAAHWQNYPSADGAFHQSQRPPSAANFSYAAGQSLSLAPSAQPQYESLGRYPALPVHSPIPQAVDASDRQCRAGNTGGGGKRRAVDVEGQRRTETVRQRMETGFTQAQAQHHLINKQVSKRQAVEANLSATQVQAQGLHQLNRGLQNELDQLKQQRAIDLRVVEDMQKKMQQMVKEFQTQAQAYAETADRKAFELAQAWVTQQTQQHESKVDQLRTGMQAEQRRMTDQHEQLRTQTNARMAAVAARQVRTSGTYTSAAAKRDQQDRHIRKFQEELAKHPGVRIVPAPAPEMEEAPAVQDNAERMKSVADWVAVQMVNEKKMKEKDMSRRRAPSSLAAARKEQQRKLTRPTDHEYKNLVRNIFGDATGLRHTEDARGFSPAPANLVEDCKNGQSQPPENSFQFFFGPSYVSCLWNRLLIGKLVDQTVDARKENPELQHLPDVDRAYITSLHNNILKRMQDEWKRHQQRPAETEDQAHTRVAELAERRRVKVVSNSRKARKLQAQLDIAKKMKGVYREEHQAGTRDVFENTIQVLKALGAAGMSSEEETTSTSKTQNGQYHRTMALEVKIVPWRAFAADNFMEMLDWFRKKDNPKHFSGHDRIRGTEFSESLPPAGLPRNLFNPRWLENEQQYDPDIVDTFKIGEPNFSLRRFEFNGLEQSWGEDAGNDGDDEEEEEEAFTDELEE